MDNLEIKRDAEMQQQIAQEETQVNTGIQIDQHRLVATQAENIQSSITTQRSVVLRQLQQTNDVQIPTDTAQVTTQQVPVLDTKSKRKKFFKKEKARANTDNGLMDDTQCLATEKLLNSNWEKKQSKIYENVLKGDYSKFEELEYAIRNLLATQYMNENFANISDNYTDAKEFAAIIRHNKVLYNPLLRLGIALSKNTGFRKYPPKFMKELDEKLATEVMFDTLTKIATTDDIEDKTYKHKNLEKKTPEEVLEIQEKDEALETERKNKILQKNRNGQVVIAKSLMLLQLGKVKKVTSKGKEDWPGDVASAFTYGGRTAFITPIVSETTGTKADENRFFASLYGNNEQPIFGRRTASTHDIKRRNVAEHSEFKEKKRKFFNPNITQQMGLNVAIGGLGNDGVQGSNGQPQKIKNDGSCGHIYSMKKESDAGENGAILMGIESDAPYVTNQQGHMHNMFATPEKANSFGSFKSGLTGDHYGGRVADLSDYKFADITDILSKIEIAMDKLAGGTNDEINEMIFRPLVGKQMSEEEIYKYIVKLDNFNSQL